ncbi:MAG: hypothetical protein HQK79_23110 [Desulfobacterales bacterium]|nr:hypothetical protein [Desulfobacterales bacterium]
MRKSYKRLRILFEIDGQLKSFYWFECKNDDIYWGYSGKATQILSTPFDGLSASINLSECISEIFSTAKVSYHESGQFHIKLQEENGLTKYDSVMRWRKKPEITEPFRIMALFTKPPKLYDNYNRSPTRKGNKAAIIKIDTTRQTRHYVEFFLSPEGTFTCPIPLISMASVGQDQPVLTYSLSTKYILIVRMLHLPMEHDFNRWHPDKELCFYTEDKTVVPTHV